MYTVVSILHAQCHLLNEFLMHMHMCNVVYVQSNLGYPNFNYPNLSII